MVNHHLIHQKINHHHTSIAQNKNTHTIDSYIISFQHVCFHLLDYSISGHAQLLDFYFKIIYDYFYFRLIDRIAAVTFD